MDYVVGGLFAHWRQDIEMIMRLLVAAILAGILGWERESERKSAGLRTHILVGVGSALFMCIVAMEIEAFPHEPNVVQFDPIRVIQGVAAGIAFLGGGIIFVDKSKNRVRGLTTAASVWATTGIGLTVGIGRYVVATLATLLIWIVLRVEFVIAPQKQVPEGDPDEDIYEEREEEFRRRPNAGAM
jgi:putative Mg2+ transporter-C (MgtC) family protein